MATAEEIRARVERADKDRIKRRADAAAKVGELAERRKVLADELAELEQELGAAVGEAEEVMTLGELAEFTGQKTADVDGWRLTGRRRGATTKRRGTARRTSSRAPAQLAAEPAKPAADGADDNAGAANGERVAAAAGS